jgi:hypothetical protein
MPQCCNRFAHLYRLVYFSCVFRVSVCRRSPPRAQANHKSLEAILRSEIQSRMQGEERAVAEVQRSGKELSAAMAALQRDVRTRFQAVTAALQVRCELFVRRIFYLLSVHTCFRA